MSEFEGLIGEWKSVAPWDSDDYLALYTIGGTSSKPIVSGKDLNDGEVFKISDVRWDGKVLSFISYMPSTRRRGVNRFYLNKSGCVTSEFTFTVIEELTREST